MSGVPIPPAPKRKRVVHDPPRPPRGAWTKKDYVRIGTIIIVALAAVFGVLFLAGGKQPTGQPGENLAAEPDRNLLSGQDAYTRAMPLAVAWASDAQLDVMHSASGTTGPSGRSNDWELFFVAKSKPNVGYHVVIQNAAIVKQEQIPYIGSGSPAPPSNLISSKEAVDYVHSLKGYGNVPVLSTELFLDPVTNQWRWSVRTSIGITSISAERGTL